jgi:sorting nexin-4
MASEIVSIVVDQPQSSGFGPRKHTTYRITSSCSGGASATCRHRFSEFLAVRNELLEALPGVVIPPLPEKQMMNKFADEFVEKRREMLQIFLERCLNHPLVSVCERLHTFLLWAEPIRTPVISANGSFRVPPLPSESASDALVDAMKQLGELEQHIKKIREKFKGMQSRQNSDGSDLLEISFGMKAMADLPMNSVLALALNPFSNGLQALATHNKERSEGTKNTLLQKL